MIKAIRKVQHRVLLVLVIRLFSCRLLLLKKFNKIRAHIARAISTFDNYTSTQLIREISYYLIILLCSTWIVGTLKKTTTDMPLLLNVAYVCWVGLSVWF